MTYELQQQEAEIFAEAQQLFREIKQRSPQMRAERLALIDVVKKSGDVVTLEAVNDFLDKEGLAEAHRLLSELQEMSRRMRAERMALIGIVKNCGDAATLEGLDQFFERFADWTQGPVEGHA